ncbi:glutamine amidotransferase-related protein [Leptolyngbya sp. PCC 6406]|uniref:glutamine amidotransferase-related protein n=1 Tax=Leptolyngbya sp. PCC 6406 TaxID=1173264 RepID=UPI0002AC7EC9|nr:GMP synthase [Leptolyngbya sp. PCC 6406]
MGTTGQVLMVVHQENSDPGLMGEKLRSRGYHLDTRCPALGDPLPHTLEHHTAVIVFGGPMSANDDDTLPFIRTELDWIRQTVLPAPQPYLGICLGAQLLARTLGGTVAPHPEGIREIGYYPLRAVAAGQSIFPPQLQVYHWHGEGFTVPPQAVPLATGDTFANQAFVFNDRAYGLQFHPEITAPLIQDWTRRGADQLTLPGAQPRERHIQSHHHYGAQVDRWLDRFLDHWLAEAPTAEKISA